MRKLLLLACMACTGHGRRVHSSMERSWSSSAADHETKPVQALADLLQATEHTDAFNPSSSGARVPVNSVRSTPAQMAEMRIDTTGDGGTYTMEEFKEWYTEQGEDWEAKWNAAEPAGDQKTLEELNINDEVEGTVLRLAPFGAFVDIGARSDALLHISQIRDEFISDIYEVLEEGQEVKARIKEIDIEKGRIGLTMRSDGGGGGGPGFAADPNLTPLDELTVGQTITGTVKAIMPFGAFVDIGAQKDGLLHISEITNEFVADVNEQLSMGQEVTATIKELDAARGRIGLTCRDGGGGGGGGGASFNEAGTPLEELEEGMEVTGTVMTIMSFGAFVDIGAQKQALLHISEITDEYISDVNEKLAIGDEVTAIIKELDLDQGKIGISSRDM